MPVLAVAAVAGLVHAAFSFYWAFGGRWLLDTVGQWAIDLAHRSPVGAGIGLALIGLAKVAGALIPYLVEAGRIPRRRYWRIAEVVGAIVLTLYGLVNCIVAWAVLGSVIATPHGYHHAAEIGHAALWDPLFALWGILLLVGLARTRHRPAADHS